MNAEASLALEYLATIELFRDLSSDKLCEVMALARVRRFDKDALIFNQGDAAGRAHVLVEGSVRISQSGSDGAQVVMRFNAPGGGDVRHGRAVHGWAIPRRGIRDRRRD
jgi:hypothetical protein